MSMVLEHNHRTCMQMQTRHYIHVFFCTRQQTTFSGDCAMFCCATRSTGWHMNLQVAGATSLTRTALYKVLQFLRCPGLLGWPCFARGRGIAWVRGRVWEQQDSASFDTDPIFKDWENTTIALLGAQHHVRKMWLILGSFAHKPIRSNKRLVFDVVVGA